MRSIDYYLTEEEQAAISDFMFKGIVSIIVEELKLKKRIELNQQLSKQVPDTPLTYRKFLKKNNVDCPIEEFLLALSRPLENKKFRLVNHGILQNLGKGLDECKAPCPCPAECD